MQCDLCGKDTTLFRVKIEGTVLNVCKECSSFGKVIAKVEPPRPPIVKAGPAKPKSVIEVVVSDYASIIRNKREAMSLKQRDFAKQINEKESLVHKIETGTFTPPIKLARKIERFLGVKLDEEVEEEQPGFKPQQSITATSVTLGDVIKIKQRK